MAAEAGAPYGKATPPSMARPGEQLVSKSRPGGPRVFIPKENAKPVHESCEVLSLGGHTALAITFWVK